MLKINEEEEINVLGAKKKKATGLTIGGSDWQRKRKCKKIRQKRKNRRGKGGGYFRKEVLRIICGKGKK